MKDLACYGSYDADNKQCIKCDDVDCKKILDLKMECVEQCKEDILKCALWNTQYCILHH